MTTHADQQRLWQEEHRHPHMLLPMEATAPSSGVVRFFEWLSDHSREHLHGIEMGCGKGRNAIWLAEQGMHVTGFDFSEHAVNVAKDRAKQTGVSVDFLNHDATAAWPFESTSFDVGIDCFASSDIESKDGRAFARDEFLRILKPDSYLFVHAISSQSPFHRSMIERFPGSEPGSFLHESGKFEKTYDEVELREWYRGWHVVICEKVQSNKPVEFYGKQYSSENFFLILQKS